MRNDLAAGSQISPVSNGRSSASPGVTQNNSPSPSSFNPAPGGPGVFPCKSLEHDMMVNNRLGGLGWNASNNSCKTLKCPKCNLHYKTQETLEIHMKEKHPDSDSNCFYCGWDKSY